MRFIFLTPFKGDFSSLIALINSQAPKLTGDDRWLIILDNQNYNLNLINEFSGLEIYSYVGEPGAGNARNFGLNHIKSNYTAPFLLVPIDADDILLDGSLTYIRNKFLQSNDQMISFGHYKNWSDKSVKIGYDGIFNLEHLLKKYITPCGSTVIKVSNIEILSEVYFGHRRVGNDILFFLLAVKKFKTFRCDPFVVLSYNVGNINSLSGNKMNTLVFRYLALKDFGLPLSKIFFLMIRYVHIGIMRYVFRQSI